MSALGNPPEVPRPGGHQALDEARQAITRDQREQLERIEFQRTHWFEIDSKLSSDNQLEVLQRGDALEKARSSLIASARRSIYVSTYSLTPEAVGFQFVKDLCTKKADNPELDIRLIYDYGHLKRTGDAAIERARACGIPALPYNWSRQTGLANRLFEMHEKLLIVDGLSFITGGSNYGPAYLTHSHSSDSWQDLDILTAGPAACIMHREFIQNWKDTVRWTQPLRFVKRWKDSHRDLIGSDDFAGCEEVPAGHSRVLPVYSNPHLRHRDKPLLERYLKAIRSADEEILLYMPYLMPRPLLRDALIAARQLRNVKVKIITNSAASSDEKPAHELLYAFSRSLLQAGVEIVEWPNPGTLHRKAGVIDRKYAFIGSDNLTGRAQSWNTESVVFTDDAVAVRLVRQQILQDMRSAHPLTLAEAQSKWSELGWFGRRVFGILQPYLTGED